MARGDAAAIRAFLQGELARALAPDGWGPASPTRDSPFDLAKLVRPLQDDIAATASVGRASGIPDRLPVRITHVHVGVSYEPLRRLWPLLGDRFELALVHENAWPGEADDDQDEVHDELLEVSSAGDAGRALDIVTGAIRRAAVTFAQQYGSLERLLAEFGYDENRTSVSENALALLAAAGRFDEARAALARYRPPDTGHGPWDRQSRQFVHQIGRYIDSGGDPAIVPSHPPPTRFASAEMPSVSEIWTDTRARRDAVRVAKAMSPETNRAELRATLERELAERGVSASPLWIERTLDHLHDSRAEQARLLGKGLWTAGDLAFRAIRGIRQHRSPPDLAPPAWLKPPDRAAYPVPSHPQAGWAEVELDEGAAPYLERAYAAIPRLVGSSAIATAWLVWEEGPRERLIVSLGGERVGTLPPEVARAYRRDMDGAAQRDELPYVPARLTPRPSGYLLEIQQSR